MDVLVLVATPRRRAAAHGGRIHAQLLAHYVLVAVQQHEQCEVGAAGGESLGEGARAVWLQAHQLRHHLAVALVERQQLLAQAREVLLLRGRGELVWVCRLSSMPTKLTVFM